MEHGGALGVHAVVPREPRDRSLRAVGQQENDERERRSGRRKMSLEAALGAEVEDARRPLSTCMLTGSACNAVPRVPWMDLDLPLQHTSRGTPTYSMVAHEHARPAEIAISRNRGVERLQLSPPAGEVVARSGQCSTFAARRRVCRRGGGMSRRCRPRAHNRKTRRSAL